MATAKGGVAISSHLVSLSSAIAPQGPRCHHFPALSSLQHSKVPNLTGWGLDLAVAKCLYLRTGMLSQDLEVIIEPHVLASYVAEKG